MERPVSDALWQRLNPDVGGRRKRWVERAWLAVILAVGLSIPANLVWVELRPDLELTSSADIGALPRPAGSIRAPFGLSNRGNFDVTVVRVELASPGLQVLAVEGQGSPGEPSPFPLTLRDGDGVWFMLTVRVTDCAAVDIREPWRGRAVLRWPWGDMSVDVPGPSASSEPDDVLVDFWCGR